MIDRDVVPVALGVGETGHVLDAFVAEGLDPSLAFVVVGEGINRTSLVLRFAWDAPIPAKTPWRARADRAKAGSSTPPPTRRPHRWWNARCAPEPSCSTTARITFAWEGDARPEAGSSQRFGYESGAQRWILDDSRLVTLHRRMPRVQNSAVAFLRHLRERGFAQAPRLFGTALVTDRSGETWVAVTSQTFVQNPTDVEAALREILRTRTADERLIRSAENVADALAALHRALATPGSDPTFGTHSLTPDDVAAWRALRTKTWRRSADARAASIAALREQIAAAIDALPGSIEAASARAHGRLTLSRVLLVGAVPVFTGFGEALARRSSPAQRRRVLGSLLRCGNARGDPGERARPDRRSPHDQRGHARPDAACTRSLPGPLRGRRERSRDDAARSGATRRADPLLPPASGAARRARGAVRTLQCAGRRLRSAAGRAAMKPDRYAHQMLRRRVARRGRRVSPLGTVAHDAAAVIVDGATCAMESRGDGWFERTVRDARAGSPLCLRVPGIRAARPRSGVALSA